MSNPYPREYDSLLKKAISLGREFPHELSWSEALEVLPQSKLEAMDSVNHCIIIRKYRGGWIVCL